MFFVSRSETRKVIAGLQLMACAYRIIANPKDKNPVRCDCKYGGTNLMKGTETGNGCPELRSVDAVLSVMTDREWKMLVKRVGKRDSKTLRAAMKKAAKKRPKKVAVQFHGPTGYDSDKH